MSGNVHQAGDLKQYQSLPLEAKIIMTKQRIRIWYESWSRLEIYNEKTGKTRYKAVDTRNRGTYDEPKLRKNESIINVYPGAAYLGFSGGIGSTVLKHIIDSMYDDVPAVFVNTGLEYPEIQQFVRRIKNGEFDCFNSDVEIVRPEMRFDEVIKTYGYPMISKEVSQCVREAKIGIERNDGSYEFRIQRITGTGRYAPKDGKKSLYDISRYRFMLDAPYDISDECCKVMKKRPSRKYARESGRKPILGTMASESRLRAQRWLKYGCNAFDADADSQASNPLSFWTEQDILHYIKKYNVPYCSVYGDIRIKQVVDNDRVFEGQINMADYLGDYEPEYILETTGCKRTGCIFCGFGCHLEKAPNRFQRLKETHPRQYDYCINGGEMVDGKWQPSKEGLGLGKVLDYIGVKYD